MVREITISSLDFPDNIRRRPGMYIGSTQDPSVIQREVIDNSLDEVLAGYAKDVIINIDNKNYLCYVADNGRGLPVYEAVNERGNEIERLEISRFVFSKTHIGSKFDNSNTDFSTGMNGIIFL